MKSFKELMTVNVSVTNKTIVRVIGVIIAAYLTLQFISAVSEALVLIIIAFFLAVALFNPVNWLASRVPGQSRVLATAIAYLALIAVVGSLLYALIPPLISQSQNFIQDLPDLVENLEEGDSALSGFVRDFEIKDFIADFQEEISTSFTSAGGQLFSGLRTVSSSLASTLVILVLTFFMVVEAPMWLRRFWLLFPRKKRTHYKELAHKMHRVVSGYVNGQLLVAFIAGLSSLVMMLVLNIPFAISLAALVAVFGLIPMIGATIGSIVVILVALTQSFISALIMAGFFLIYQQLENNLIQPKIQSKTVDLSPLTVLVAGIVGIYYAGLLGALLAIPVAGSVKVLLEDYVNKKGLLNR